MFFDIKFYWEIISLFFEHCCQPEDFFNQQLIIIKHFLFIFFHLVEGVYAYLKLENRRSPQLQRALRSNFGGLPDLTPLIEIV